jgi:hypothetical protein
MARTKTEARRVAGTGRRHVVSRDIVVNFLKIGGTLRASNPTR